MYNLSTFLEVEPPALEKIGEVAAKIAYYNFDWRYVTLVVFNAVQYTLALGTFLKYYKLSVNIKRGKYISHRRVHVPQFVIFGQDANEIVDTLKWLDKMKFDNSGKYIVICTTDDYERCEEDKIFVTLSNLRIVNVIYMRGETCDNFLSFSYNLVLPENCLNSEPYSVYLEKNCTKDECFKTVFSEKLNNLYKCPLIISTFEQPPFMYLSNDTLEPSGGDGDILRILVNALNATLEIKLPTEGNDFGHYGNGNWTGSLGDVFNRRAHLSVCSQPLTTEKYENFQISFVYNTMDIVWTARLPTEEPAWQKLFNPLEVDMRIALSFTFLAVVLLNSLLKSSWWCRVRTIFNIGSTRFSLLFYSWTLFLGVPILRMPTSRPFLLVVFSWIWFSFVIKSAYQAALISSLKKPSYIDFFQSFNDVLKAKYPYGGLGTLRDYYAEDQYVYDNWVLMDFDEANDFLDKASEGNSDFVLAFNKEFVIQHLIEYNGVRHLQILPHKIVNSPTVMFFKKHSVLVKPINRVLEILVEAGFCQIMHAKYLRRKKFLFQLSIVSERRALTFENFKACILLLAFGWFLALIFFVAEAYCGRLPDN